MSTSSLAASKTELVSKVHQLISEVSVLCRLFSGPKIIHEICQFLQHLEQAKLLGTRGAFIHECGELGLPTGLKNKAGSRRSSKTSPETGASFDKIKTLLLQAFDQVDSLKFFEIWNDPERILHTYGSKVYARLNFRLFLSFNCRGMALQKLDVAECMQNIRTFFDREGAFLASDQEFIHYFALPFVIDPTKHPSFQGLFEVLKFIFMKIF